MTGEIPGNSEEAKNKLRNILDSFADAASNKMYKLFGPLEESGISREQFEEL